MARQHLDVVVVGAGSSGAVVASRLSEDSARTVLLLEAGPDFPDEATSPPGFLVGGNLLGHNFAGAGAATPDLDWNYWSEPLANGRRVHLRRGRMVGGTSMVNGTVAVRGKPSDFDRWREHGAPGWGWEDVRPVFEKIDRELAIKRYPPERWQAIQHPFVEGFEELGYRRAENMNAPDAWDGVVGPWPQHRWNEIRQGTLVTYVRWARARPNFEVRGRCLVDRVLLTGSRATGVRYFDAQGRAEEVSADLIVLSAGAYGSPPILLRSGIGPAAELAALGVTAVADLPVGRHLREHPQCFFYLRTPPELAAMSGPGFAVVARGDGWWSFPLALDEEEGVCALAFGLASEDDSGTVTLRSSDPADPPRIDHRYQDVIERAEFASAWQTFCELTATSAVTRRGAQNADAGRPLEDILAERLGTAFHPVGSCAIGKVVDEDLRAYGIEGLMVADASVFPLHVTNNPNLTCLMIGERAAAKAAAG